DTEGMRSDRMQTLELRHYTLSTCLGLGREENWARLAARAGNLKPCDFDTVQLPTWIGEVRDVDQVQLSPELADFDCRNNRLAQLALQQDGFEQAVRAVIEQVGAARVGCYLGTSTAGILQTELAYRRRALDADGKPGALPADFH